MMEHKQRVPKQKNTKQKANSKVISQLEFHKIDTDA